MFQPKYVVNKRLLDNIVKIKEVVRELNQQHFPEPILAAFEKESFVVSAFASTSIEGNPLPLTDVRKLLKSLPTQVRDTEREVLNYNKALEYLSTLLKNPKEITSQLVCAIQSIVVEGLLDKRNQGKLRADPVVVNDPRLRKIAYIPPDVKDVARLMEELMGYLRNEDEHIDPLILAGLFHKQFVIIHPFIDGNGRTARLITKYLLARMGLNTFNLFSFENYYNQNVSKYFASVGVYGDYYEIAEAIDFTEWLIYFTGGIIDELLRVQKSLVSTQPQKKALGHEMAILRYIKKHGSISAAEYAQLTNRAHSTRIQDLKKMVAKGWLVRRNQGKATYYEAGDES